MLSKLKTVPNLTTYDEYIIFHVLKLNLQMKHSTNKTTLNVERMVDVL